MYGEHPMKNTVCILILTGVVALLLATVLVARPEMDSTRYRGFTVSDLEMETMRDIAEQWQGNIVRYHLRTNFVAKHKLRCSVSEAWQTLMKLLPQGLKNAEKYNHVVVIDLHELPEWTTKHVPQDPKAQSAAFWADPNNLKTMVQCWQDIARICVGSSQEIWYDLYNEPLDWNDFPDYPQLWPTWAQTIINAIRAIDKQHPIVIEPGPGGLCWGFKDFPLLKGEPLIYSVHQYSPHQYTHQGIDASKNMDLARTFLAQQKTWPGSFDDSDGFTAGGLWNKARIARSLQPVRAFQAKHQVRIFVGEFSVVRYAPNADRFLQDSLELFEDYGWDWTYHGWKESPFWRLDCTDSFSEIQLASTPTQRAKVIQTYMVRNERNSLAP